MSSKPKSTFSFEILVPKTGREDFFASLWTRWKGAGLVGIDEGTVLAEEAHRQGLETESFTVDSALAPRERDWIGEQELARARVYFAMKRQAESARKRLVSEGFECGEVEECPEQDWHAQWKAEFRGTLAPPFWQILPPEGEKLDSDLPALWINPGAGFGTGTHETTRLCLEALGRVLEALTSPGEVIRVLDFGSGSGILSIAAARMGAESFGVELDELALENALENARLNGVERRTHWSRELPAEPERFEIVVANILKPVLLRFCAELVGRLRVDPARARGAQLILSGLMEPDLAEVREAYRKELALRFPDVESSEWVREMGEWRAVGWACG